MSDSIKKVYNAILVLEKASMSFEFEKWLFKEHTKKINSKILHGYKFFIDVAFSHFAMSLANDDSFGLTESELFQRAKFAVFPIDKLPSTGNDTCEKIILLKNLFKQFEPIRRARSFDEIKNVLTIFIKRNVLPIKLEIENNIQFNKKMGKNNYLKLTSSYELYTYFNQIGNNGPYAYDSVFYKTYLLEKNKIESCFEGYKYTLQFLWQNVIGIEVYSSSSLKLLHTATSWKEYKTYTTARKNANDLLKMLSEKFNIGEQSCLDSYFYRIQSEIIKPLEEEFNIDITQTNTLLKIGSSFYSDKKILFKNLLSKKHLVIPKLSPSEKLDVLLLWYSVQIIYSDESPLHAGVSSFLTSMFGAVELRRKNKNRKFEKIIICKIVTSVGKNKNEYSYGVLLDLATAIYNNYGWVFYYNNSGDYSGFSGEEYRLAEKHIEEYLKLGLIELRELRINKNDLNKYVLAHRQNIEISGKEETLNIHNQELQRINGVANEMRGVLFEMLCYYLASKHYESKGHSVTWSGMRQNREDIEVVKNEEIIVVECKINIDNCDYDYFEEIITRKLDKYNQTTKSLEIWVWHKPTRDYSNLLEKGIKIKILSTNRRDLMPFLEYVNMDLLGRMFNSID